MDTGPVAELKNLRKTFRTKTGAVDTLKDVSITVAGIYSASSG
jgi:ABC-type oligopeptide transport system ATPase subunit